MSFDKIGPPWVTSHLGLKAYEGDMRASMLKITEVCSPCTIILLRLPPSKKLSRETQGRGWQGTDEEVNARLKEKVLDDDFVSSASA